MTYKGIDLTFLLTGLLALVTSAITWAASKLGKAADATTKERSAAAAAARIGVLATTLLGRAWDKLGPQIQAAIADGKVTDEERAELEAAAKAAALGMVGEEELTELAKAIGLPLPGLIAKLASMMLDTFTKAHDPGNQTVSMLAFPVAEDNGDHGG